MHKRGLYHSPFELSHQPMLALRLRAICRSILILATFATPAAVAPAQQHDDDVGSSRRTYAPIDAAKVEAAGIRRLAGKHLTLYTDLPARAAVDELPAVVDAAFPQWCAYFNLKPEANAGWHLTGCLMKDKDAFVRAGLLTPDLPTFVNGYSWHERFWMVEQPSDYYRRHLVLHEATHSFMSMLLGGCGSRWYMEGTAEFLSTHRWNDGQLLLGYMPKNREEALMWGRIRILHDAVAEHRAFQLRSALDHSGQVKNYTERYAWDWALATLLGQHPAYRDRFRQLQKFVAERDFDAQFERLFAADWQQLAEQWQLFVLEIDFGYDVPRMAIDFTPGRPIDGEATVPVAADRGWQNTGIALAAGATYRLTATGRYQLAAQPQPWPCEPGGVTMHYWRGQPRGILLAAVRPAASPTNGLTPLARPAVIGLDGKLSPTTAGTLYLKINDAPGQLPGNRGQATVKILRIDGS